MTDLRDLTPDSLALGLLNYSMTGSVSGEELKRFPRALSEGITSPLTLEALSLFKADIEAHGSLDVDRVYGGNNGAGAVRDLMSNILERDFPPVEMVLSAIKRVREAALEDLVPLSAGELVASDMPDEEGLIDGLLAAAWVLVVGGLVKTRKTWMLLQMALHMAAGVPFLGHAVLRKMKVLYIGGEGSLRTIHKRLRLV